MAWRTVLRNAASRVGVLDAIGRLPARAGVVFLVYHRVGGPAHPWLLPTLDPAVFEEHLAHLRRRYEVLALEDALRYLRGEDRGPHRAVVVTFDDGYADNYRHALPALLRHRIPATLFLTTGCVGERRLFWWDALGYAAFHTGAGDPAALYARLLRECRAARPWSHGAVQRRIAALGVHVPAGLGDDLLLCWEQVREMHEAGVAFGGHTDTHPWMAGLPGPERWDELTRPRPWLDRYAPATFRPFAYPNGFYDPELEGMTARAGFACALTCEVDAPGELVSAHRVGRLIADVDALRFRDLAAGLPRFSGLRPGSPTGPFRASAGPARPR